ncbi:MAG: flagellar hook-basal body complex protein FliE [Deltaproteobacteria bacterium]|nr:MAG: flagellar hook-basal body complex protein FliE [Deltaproteobacteria bacterium]
MSINNINGSRPPLSVRPPDTSQVSKAKDGFSELFDKTVNEVIKSQQQGEQAIYDLQSGKAQNLHEVMIAVEQADLSLRMMVQLRNKALEAYNEIMKMNI